MKTSTKPYLIRALYEWCVDSEQTPHIAVWVDEQTKVPMQFVKDGEIVLNIGPNACQGLNIANDWVSFSARFGGVAHDVWLPTGNVLTIFARETGEGMGFELEQSVPEAETEPEAPAVEEAAPTLPSHLKIIK
ncbi:MAG: ClpXP protease specificity-enhancing factor [Neisseriaceae bacterium]|nr:ClpXP protease specificity-enhancing factor [Neisseriaceae bacterium]MBP6862918.1 ClpXP protease specificity-enhancing factor [Neisseriaceae bacterium]